MNDPELVVLDEPMSGLDPIGRKEVRDLILELRDKGKTVFFSSHILTDIEAIADHVAIVARGQLTAQGTPAQLIERASLGTDVTIRIAGDVDDLTQGATRVRRTGEELSLTLPPDADVDAWLARVRDKAGKVISVAPRHETLEDLFLRRIASADETADATEGRV
jgi:ABC-2 type transport system ATP-binding protein